MTLPGNQNVQHCSSWLSHYYSDDAIELTLKFAIEPEKSIALLEIMESDRLTDKEEEEAGMTIQSSERDISLHY